MINERRQSEAESSLSALANRVLPAGGFGNVADQLVVARGSGGRVWDVSGNEYIDYLLGSGPMLIGHAHPEIFEAVFEQIPRGTTFFANNEHGIRLAAEIVDAVPCAEKVRFVSSGTEADLYAMRLARAFTGRDKILKFEGGYHGMSDYALMSLAPKRPGNFPEGVPDTAGIPRSVQSEVLVAPFNDVSSTESLIREHREELGGVIVEPFQRLIPPKPGFLEGLRELTSKYGIPLIFDEVVTGFRFAYGGAQSFYNVIPDICTLGKVIGGGFPLAAIAGRADIMAHFDRAAVGDDRFVYQVGTLSGNPVAAIAGLKTLEILKRPGAYDRIFATGLELMHGFEGILKRSGIPAQIIGAPPLFDVAFASGEIADYRATLRNNTAMQKRFNASMRSSGILKGESKFYISLAHDERDVRQTLDAFARAIEAVSREES